MLLLAQFALMLYYTPFLLSGFSWSPDSLWHAGVAKYMPQILTGADIAIANYAEAYPLLYSMTYAVYWTTGISVFDYTLYVYPVACTILFSILAYFFADRMFGSKTAFFAILFTLPALHYVEMHVSPFSSGTIILLIALILSTYQGKLPKLLSVFAILLLVLVHPISPVMLAVYFFSVIFINLFFRKNISPETSNTKVSAFLHLVLISSIWGIWIIYASSVYIGVQNAVSSALSLNFLSRLFAVSDFTVGGSGFIYPEIQNLSLFIYGLIFILIYSDLARHLRDLKGIFSAKFGAMTCRRLSLTMAASIFAAMGFLLFLSSGERFLLGRGLLYFIFMGSMVIATYFVNESTRLRRVKILLALGLVVFLVCTFPVISYSKEAYNTFTPSANAGLRFLSIQTDLSQNSLSMSYDQQLATYVDLSKGLNLRGFPADLNASRPDVIVMRINAYYLIAMRDDLSFINNSYTELSASLEASWDYNKIYSNSQFEIYEHIG